MVPVFKGCKSKACVKFTMYCWQATEAVRVGDNLISACK